MRYRALSAGGDYVFGRGSSEFLANVPEAVGQAVRTRLGLWTGEWFLDTFEGTPYRSAVLGENTRPIYDQAIKHRILGTQGVISIQDYASVLNTATRRLQVAATINTLYGTTQILTVVQTP